MSRRPLHVLWLIDHVCYDGSLHGGGRLFRNLVPEFDPERVRVFPYFLRSSEEVRRVFADAPVPVPTLGKGKYDPTTLFTLWRLCRRQRIDVLHLYCYASSSFGRLLGVATGIPTVIHDFDTQVYFGYPLYLRVLDRLLARSTGRALAASPLTRAYMRDVRRIPGERIELLTHAVPESLFDPRDAAARARGRELLGAHPHELVFCAVTKLGPDRGNEELLRAFALLARKERDVLLALVYKPTYYHRIPEQYQDVPWIRDTARMRGMLDEQVAELGIAERVRFVESLDHPHEYLSASDAFVVPFLHERFSSVYLLEALASGLPAIVTDLGEQRELVRHGENGLLVPAGDVGALAAAMERLAADPQARQHMGERARTLARSHGIRAAALRLSALYEELAR